MKDIVLSFAGLLKENILLRRTLIILWHLIGVVVTYVSAFEFRFDGAIDTAGWTVILKTAPFLCLTCLVVFTIFRLHSGLWSYFSMDDLPKICWASLTTVAVFTLGLLMVDRNLMGVPRTALILECFLFSAWAAGGRYIVRYFREYKIRKEQKVNSGDEDRILAIGDLHDCDLIIRSARVKSIGNFVAVVSDKARENNTSFHGMPVFHTSLNDIGRIAKEIEANSILILPPFNKPVPMSEIIDSCTKAEIACNFRQVPSLKELATGEVEVSSIKEVELEDLLDRGQRKLDRTMVHANIAGRNVMVTGAGGSIGSELCRQIARYSPNVLVLFEINEFALYTIEKDIKEHYPNLKIIAFAGDIRHPEEVETAIEIAGGIDILYHAAAYKHVPLMEENVPACFRNNVLGTYRLAEVAQLCHVKRFVMISTDKAVRPSNIMGASKRIAERTIAEREPNGTNFVAVRFGNVLGSSGSVVPLFKKQIAAGGPVTVTSPEMRRFFMTIPEAVELVLQAGAVGQRGEVMVLEMGEPVKIVDMARKLIELSGFVPGRDIKIKFSGLRAGEKEYEEIMTEDENLVRTAHDKIWVMTKNGDESKLPPVSIGKIEQLVALNDEERLRKLAEYYVPENTFPGTTSTRKTFRPEKSRELSLTTAEIMLKE